MQKCLHARAAHRERSAYQECHDSPRHSDGPEYRIHHGLHAVGSTLAGYVSAYYPEKIFKRDINTSLPDRENEYKKAQDGRYRYLKSCALLSHNITRQELSENLLENIILDVIERLGEVSVCIRIDALCPLDSCIRDVVVRT